MAPLRGWGDAEARGFVLRYPRGGDHFVVPGLPANALWRRVRRFVQVA
jgi:hypothetical protein